MAIPAPYIGRILSSTFSDTLSNQLKQWIEAFHAFDIIGSPSMPYISAWECGSRIIWYEFASRRLSATLQCSPPEVAQTFRDSIKERRVYHHTVPGGGIGERVWSSGQIQTDRTDLRREVQESGLEEAVYKIEPVSGDVIWLKDSAAVIPFMEDRIMVSLGNLTNVSKEMEQEEALKNTKEALRMSEQKYRYQATHDNLTDLYNSRYLYKALTKLKEESASAGKQFSLVFLDIDDFKKVVDTHGHLHASQVIQEVGHTIGRIISPPAFGVAYAGDEFVIVLPGVGKDGAMAMAEKVRERIRETKFLENQRLYVRIQASFGVATHPDDAQDLMHLLALADKAMFGVKTTGKDRVAGT
jgi:diguanylate cyclase (GGDEF)-like protein